MDVTLRPMTEPEYTSWREGSVVGFADDLARSSGRPRDEVLPGAREQFAEFLPDGPLTEGMWLLIVLDDNEQRLGTLWLGGHPRRPRTGFVYDIEIDEPHRGRGVGRATMIAAERLLADAGCTAVGLSVFGFNASARGLYDSLGYGVVSTQMLKIIGDET